MKISLLKKRENFHSILVSSIEKFCSDYFNHEVSLAEPDSEKLLFRINPHINLIYPTSLGYSKRLLFSREFSYADGKIKRLLQSFYCCICISRFFETWLSPKLFSCSTSVPGMTNWAILPGNHSIRIVDLYNDISFVILKKGFEKKFLKAEVDIRVSSPFIKAPRIISVCPQFNWYSEKRINGLPLNRISSLSRRKQVMEIAFDNLLEVQERAIEEISGRGYLLEITNTLEQCVRNTQTLSHETLSLLSYLRVQVQTVLKSAEDIKIELSQTHGDFQEANIIDDGENVWIIDWEYSEKRSRFYDFITMDCSTRVGNSVHLRFFSKFKECQANGGIKFGNAFQPGSAHLLLAIYIIEDVLLKVMEVSAEAIQQKEMTLKPYLVELKIFFKLTGLGL